LLVVGLVLTPAAYWAEHWAVWMAGGSVCPTEFLMVSRRVGMTAAW